MPTNDTIQYAFTAGEVAKNYFQRADLTKYDIGVALARNFYVDPRGGLTSRPGSELAGPVKNSSKPTKFFRFEGTVSDTLMVFGENYIRFMQNGGYLVEASKNVTAVTQTVGAVFTIVGHEYTDNEWVYVESTSADVGLAGRYFVVKTPTVDTFQLQDPGFDIVDGTGFGPGLTAVVSRVYEVSTPYAGEALAKLDVEQNKNEVRLSHVDYARRVLTFNAADDWDLSLRRAASTLAKPTGVTLTPSAAGDAGVAVVVTAVDDKGIESIGSEYALEQLSVNYATTEGSLQIKWDPVAGAKSYNVYRSLLIPGTPEVTKGESTGFIGVAYGAQFTDTNITPDFTKTPPVFHDPFTKGKILAIDITNGGSGYSKAATVSVSGGGSDFDGYPVVNDDGEITAISIVNGGRGYSAPVTVTIGAAGGGTGATFDVTVGPEDGTFPKIFKVFQQRGLYFGTINLPDSMWASRPYAFDNYDDGVVQTAASPYSFSIDSVAVKPIKYVKTLRSGLLLFSDAGVTQIRAESGKAITGSNALAEPQAYVGVADTEPLTYNLDVLFLTEGATTVYAMLFTEYTESFKLQELSILAPHLFGPDKVVKRFVATQLPSNLIYMPRSDGRELSLTYLREQEVYAWAQHETKGLYEDVMVIKENGVEVRYQMVTRNLRGTWRKYLERVPTRRDDYLDDYWGVDCGLQYPLTAGPDSISADVGTGDAVLTTASSVFTPGNIGDIVYYAGGKFEIQSILTAVSVQGRWLRDANKVLPQCSASLPLEAGAGEWSYATPTNVVDGLWHLEGETVSVCADGNALLNLTVVDGKINLDFPATKIYVGLQYICDFQSMPVAANQSNIAAKPKRIHAVFPRLLASRGMKFGPSFDRLVEMKDRTQEAWGEALALKSDLSELLLDDNYSLDQFIVGRQEYPLPATVLGYTAELDTGDSEL